MSTTENVSVPRDPQWPTRVVRELHRRLHGPGGYYNVGNLLGLGTALGLQFAAAVGSGNSGAEAVVGYFTGSPQALALTIATTTFLFSGEVYHRAWNGGAAPDPGLNRAADILAAAGAVALAVSLLYLGQPLLAAATGLFIVLGKLGSAAFGDDASALPIWPAGWPNPFRAAVLAGRLPAIGAAALDLAHRGGSGEPVASLVQPAVLIVCHLLWIKADLLLLEGGRRGAGPAQSRT